MARAKKVSQKGVSAIIGNLVMVSVTLVVGFSLWTNTNSTASSTLEDYTDQAAYDINHIKEDFVITLISFDYPSPGNVTLWFFNSGEIDTEIIKLIAGNETSFQSPQVFAPNPLSLPVEQSGSLTIAYSGTTGETLHVIAIGKYGSNVADFKGI